MHTLMRLTYDYDALEPFIDARTMEIHHTKHHQSYVDKLNAAIKEYPELESLSVIDLISDLDNIPADIRSAVRNNGGGDINHLIFFSLLGKEGGDRPEGPLADLIDSTFGGFEEFQEAFSKAALDRFGSGWAWLSLSGDGSLAVESTPNQDSPWMYGRRPILGLDVWEHAYYLKYQDRRVEYIRAWWKIINWEVVSNVFDWQFSESVAN